jgi:hypothetical protein
MSHEPFTIFERETGDEVRVEKTARGILLAIREEGGIWHTIELESQTAQAVAEGIKIRGGDGIGRRPTR